ncbi:MAG: flavin monoamine oxidase family protein [Thermoanaerobaculia bacterium]
MGEISTAMSSPARPTVLVLGAGLAGLAALDALSRREIPAVIVEARMRPGGRAFTLRDRFSDGLYVEAGAQYIPGGHHLVLRWARDLGLTLDPVEAPPRLLHVEGRNYVAGRPSPGPPPFAFTAEERRLGLTGVLQQYLGDATTEISPHALAHAVPEALRRYDELTMSQYLASRGSSPGLIARFRIGYLNHWGNGIDEYSALFGLRDLALNDTTEEYVVRGGTDLIPAGIASKWEGKILYDAPVIAMEQDADGVTVTIGNGEDRRRITANLAICTIPFPVLRGIEVTPRWSAGKQRAVDQLSYTAVSKTFLEARDRFWDADGLAGHQSMMDSPKLCVWDRTAMQRRSPAAGVLEASFTGHDARRFLALAPAARLEYVLTHMEKIYPAIRGQVERETTICWDEDPWARGGYPWFRPGEMGKLMPHIAAPEGRIHFAGDHASARPGWMEGALESGLRAADEVQRRLAEES